MVFYDSSQGQSSDRWSVLEGATESFVTIAQVQTSSDAGFVYRLVSGPAGRDGSVVSAGLMKPGRERYCAVRRGAAASTAGPAPNERMVAHYFECRHESMPPSSSVIFQFESAHRRTKITVGIPPIFTMVLAASGYYQA